MMLAEITGLDIALVAAFLVAMGTLVRVCVWFDESHKQIDDEAKRESERTEP